MLSNNPGLFTVADKFSNKRFNIFSAKIIDKNIKAFIMPMFRTILEGAGFFARIILSK